MRLRGGGEDVIEVLKATATWIFHLAARQLPERPDENQPINPLAIGMDPAKWEEDGLFDDSGMTLPQALELLPGVEEFDLEARGATLAAG